MRGFRSVGRVANQSIWAGGFLAAVALLIVVAPVAAGAAHPTAVLKAPYKGTASNPSAYSGHSGCASVSGTAGKWVAKTGAITGSGSGTAKTCGRGVGSVGNYNFGYWSSQVVIAIPFKVLTTANHSVAINVSLSVASSQAYSHGLCPTKIVTYPPPLYSYQSAGCSTLSYNLVALNAYLVDLSNATWYKTTYSYVSVYNDSGWNNQTNCYNYGTPSCSNSTGNFSYQGVSNGNAPGSAACSLNGACTFTMWTNSTVPMPRGDRWMLDFELYTSQNAYAYASSVNGPFIGSASASADAATSGHGAKINSVTIV
jgi:hypothetical protein